MGMAGYISDVVDATKGYRTLYHEEGLDVALANINFENPICDSLKRPLDICHWRGQDRVATQDMFWIVHVTTVMLETTISQF